jgi:hypothetical protein
MKNLIVSVIVALLAVSANTASAVTIDGFADPSYGSAVSTQAIGTTAYDSTTNNLGLANGSELDAAYGFISNGVLYLVIAGNFDSLFGVVPNDTLHLFFMSDAGGTDHTLGGFYTGTYNGRINNMAGMTFDTGFTPNHWFGVNVGQDSSGSNLNMYVDYMVVCSNCASAFLGNVPPTNFPPTILTNIYFGSTIQIALNNSNAVGVTDVACYTNAQGAAQSVAASAVRSGIELALPLPVIGSPTGTVKVCAFLTDQTMTYMYNQALGPFYDGTPTYCLNLPNTTATSGFLFGSYPGQHYFKLTVPPCDVILVNPTTASYAPTGGVGTVTVANSGGCPITVATNASWLSVTSTTGLNIGNGSFNYLVATNTTVFNRQGQFIITNPEGSSIVTQTVTINQIGLTAPPLGVVTVDGTAESTYSCPLAVQQIPTSFGNSTNGSLANAVGGSELDAAYGIIQNNVLFLVFAGNLEGNGNKLDIFLQTGGGGMNTMTNLYNPNQSNINNMKGLKFGAGFAPNYLLMVNDFAGTLYADYVQLWPGGTNGTGSATNAYYLGASTPTNGTLQTGSNPFGIQIAINESNTNGVSGTGTCTVNSYPAGYAPSDVRTGVELAIPLAAIGSPTGAIAVCAFVNAGANDFLSNQVLPPIGTNDPNVTVCQNHLGSPASVNLTNQAAPYFLVGPEMRITSVKTISTNTVINCLTATTNLQYQLQTATVLSTNTAWGNIGGLQTGNGAIITLTDVSGATNKPARFYRVRQTPVCP